MHDLPRIPVPMSVWWREVRIRLLPPVVFMVAVAGCFYVFVNGPQPSTMMAVGEGVRSSVTVPQPGMVVELKVQPFQVVQKGEPIAVIMPVDPQRQLEMFRADMQLAQLRLQPSTAEQNALDYERLRLELLRTKSEMAISKVNLEKTENELRRSTVIFKENIISEGMYDLTLKTRDMYRAEYEEKSKSIATIERRMAELSFLGDPNRSDSKAAKVWLEKLEQSQLALATNWGPITLVAPITGMVSAIGHQEGEHVLDGEPLVQLNGLSAERIVGYLRQPYPTTPKIGMEVEVTTQDSKRQSFTTEIVQIGAQIETITNTLAYLRQGALVDAGLPIVLSVPANVQIRPGETVQIRLKKQWRGREMKTLASNDRG